MLDSYQWVCAGGGKRAKHLIFSPERDPPCRVIESIRGERLDNADGGSRLILGLNKEPLDEATSKRRFGRPSTVIQNYLLSARVDQNYDDNHNEHQEDQN
jgi:hypothetical protein